MADCFIKRGLDRLYRHGWLTWSQVAGPFDCKRSSLPIYRLVMGCLAVFALQVACSEPENAPPARHVAAVEYEGTIVAMGNSLTEGYGLDAQDAYPAMLESMLKEKGYSYRVVNAGISGETSTAAASRIDWVLRLAPDIVILETGANDAFRGVETRIIEQNISNIIQTLKAQDIVVVLAGMKMVTNLGRTYTSAFERLYHRLAQDHEVIFMPFFLKDVAGASELNLSDGIHPNARGYAVITENLMPYVVAAIEQHRRFKALSAAS